MRLDRVDPRFLGAGVKDHLWAPKLLYMYRKVQILAVVKN